MKASGAREDRGWFGHPRGLSTLFFTEMWERFSYYGMRALLMLFMTAPIAAGGLGWEAAKAGPIYGLYTALVYLTALPGGWLADQFVGARRAVLIGGILIAMGHLCLTVHGIPFFYSGLFLIICGTGLLKPNISTMVGALYDQNDKRRDAGFSIFYMGINLGAFIAPLTCGFLAQSEGFRGWLMSNGIRPEASWHWGFGAATVGMTLGIIQYVRGGSRLGSAGLAPARSTDPALMARRRRSLFLGLSIILGPVVLAALLHLSGLVVVTTERVTAVVGYSLLLLPIIYFGFFFLQKGWTGVERQRLSAIVLFFLFAAVFWSAFEQAGSSLNLFGDRLTRNEFLGFSFPSAWWQSVNSFILFIMAPVFAWIWVALKDREPSSPAKFAWGLLFAAAGFLVMVGAAGVSGVQGNRVGPMWLVGHYLCMTLGELCLSPVGLSAMTKLAPPRVVSQVMGLWFLALSMGNFIGGQVAGLFDTFPLPRLFGAVSAVCLAVTLIAVALIRPARKMMAGIH